MIGGYIGEPIGGVVVIVTSSNKTLVADAGSYALTGTAATLTHKWILAAGVGSYALTGSTAALTHKWILTAGVGSYTLTGTAVSLLHKWILTAGAGSYSLTGTAVSLLHKWRLTAGAGSYALTGTDASLALSANKTIAADAGSYALNGSTAALLHAWRVTVGSGSYQLVGGDADLLLAGVPVSSLVVDTDTYSQHPINCYMETLPQFRFLEQSIERQSGNKIPDKVVLSTGGKKQLSKNAPSFTIKKGKGGFID